MNDLLDPVGALFEGKIHPEVSHSPLLAAFPGAAILEFGDHGIREASWQDLELVNHWQAFLSRPESYLRYLF